MRRAASPPGDGRDRAATASPSGPAAGLLVARPATGGRISVDIGEARLDWREIPLARAQDTLHVDLALGPLARSGLLHIGNPHATFFVPDAASIDLATLGPLLEHHKLFPERANIGIAQLLSPERIRLRVWGARCRITRACGNRRLRRNRRRQPSRPDGRTAEVILEGGTLEITWREDGHVLMTGPVATSFHGSFDPAQLV